MEMKTTSRTTSTARHQGRSSSKVAGIVDCQFRNPIAIATLAVVFCLALTPALAQDSEETLGEEARPQAGLVGEAGYAWQGKADIDGGGDMQVNRFDVGLIGRLDPMERLRWTNTLFFAVNDYDFDGGGFSTGDPWGTILTLRLLTKLRYQINDQWGVFGGGVFIFSPESGANWGDSFTGGGLLGADYTHSKNLFVSLGVAVISQIEDDARVVPQVILNWLPDEHWAVRVGAVPASGGAAAAGEVAYRIIDPLEIGLGLLYNQRRFRLDDSGPAPDGVGEDNNLPLRLRLGWDIIPQLSLHFLAGVALAGEVKLDDRFGNRIDAQDYDPAPYIGVRLLGGI
jgi:opacity protein-like surface antigen